jgi:hypothetical protein
MIKTEPVKDANLPSTSKSLPTKENVNICDLIDKFDFNALSSANIKDLDLNFDSEFESLLEGITEDTVSDNQGTLSTDSDLKKLDIALSTNYRWTELNAGLSSDSSFKNLNTGISPDSFDVQAEGKKANSIVSEMQLNPLFAETEENKNHSLVTAESCQSGSVDICTKRAETSSYSGDIKLAITVADNYEIVPASNQSQELASTSFYDKSKHSDGTAAGHSLLNRSTSRATLTMQAVDISQDAVDMETVVTNDSAANNPQTADWQTMSTLQSVTKSKASMHESSDLKAVNSASSEKAIETLSYTQISHSITNGDNIATENRTDVLTAEIDTPCTVIEVQDHSYCKVKDENSVSGLPEKSLDFLSHDEASHSLSTADNIVTGKSVGDMTAEAGTPVLTPCPLTEVRHHSNPKISDETALTDRFKVEAIHSVTTESSVPVTSDILDMFHPFSATNVGDLTVEILNMALHGIPVAENVTVISSGMESVPFGTEVKEPVIRGLNFETNTAENMFSAINNITGASQLPFTTHTIIERTDVNQTVTLGMHVESDKLAAEESTYTVINGIPELAVKTMNMKPNNEPVAQCTDARILERRPLTSKVRHTENRMRRRGGSNNNNSSAGINCSQHSLVESNIELKGTGNRINSQKNKLCSKSRSVSVESEIKNDLKLDGLQYTFITNVKSQGDLMNSGRSDGAEVKNLLIDDSKKQLAPRKIENIGENSNLYNIKCKKNIPFNLSKLGSKEVSVVYLKPEVSSPYPPHEQNFSTSQPVSSESLIAVTHMGEKCVTTASKAKQNKKNEISALLAESHSGSVTGDVNLCNTQQKKSIRKRESTANTRSGLKSHVFAHISKEKFSGFTFEKVFLPQANVITYSKKENSSRAKRVSNGVKTHIGHNKDLPAPTYHSHPDLSTPITSGTDSSDRVAVLENQCSVAEKPIKNGNENTNVADHVYVRKDSDYENPDWLEHLLM